MIVLTFRFFKNSTDLRHLASLLLQDGDWPAFQRVACVTCWVKGFWCRKRVFLWMCLPWLHQNASWFLVHWNLLWKASSGFGLQWLLSYWITSALGLRETHARETFGSPVVATTSVSCMFGAFSCLSYASYCSLISTSAPPDYTVPPSPLKGNLCRIAPSSLSLRFSHVSIVAITSALLVHLFTRAGGCWNRRPDSINHYISVPGVRNLLFLLRNPFYYSAR